MPQNIRAFELQRSVVFEDDFARAMIDGTEVQACEIEGRKLVFCVLVISGGGSHVAYGAGFLNGWSQAGNRPEFKVVTGISTGSLLAPFAFLGSEWDEGIKTAYTTINGNKDILTERSLYGKLNSDSLTDTAPLAKLIELSIDDNVLEKIAVEHISGRRLYVGTTNLDKQVFTAGIWALSRPAANQTLWKYFEK